MAVILSSRQAHRFGRSTYLCISPESTPDIFLPFVSPRFATTESGFCLESEKRKGRHNRDSNLELFALITGMVCGLKPPPRGFFFFFSCSHLSPLYVSRGELISPSVQMYMRLEFDVCLVPPLLIADAFSSSFFVGAGCAARHFVVVKPPWDCVQVAFLPRAVGPAEATLTVATSAGDIRYTVKVKKKEPSVAI